MKTKKTLLSLSLLAAAGLVSTQALAANIKPNTLMYVTHASITNNLAASGVKQTAANTVGWWFLIGSGCKVNHEYNPLRRVILPGHTLNVTVECPTADGTIHVGLDNYPLKYNQFVLIGKHNNSDNCSVESYAHMGAPAATMAANCSFNITSGVTK